MKRKMPFFLVILPRSCHYLVKDSVLYRPGTKILHQRVQAYPLHSNKTIQNWRKMTNLRGFCWQNVRETGTMERQYDI